MTVRASVDTEGGDPNRDSDRPSMSGNGRYVAFQSFASDLVPGDGNGTYDVFVRDLVSGTTVRASVDTEGGDPDGFSLFPSISANARHVAFYSLASDLVPGDGNGTDDVFVRDLVSGTIVRASVDTEGDDPNSESQFPSISANGRYVAYTSDASDLVPGDRNGTNDVFVRDLVSGTTVRASVDSEGGDPNSSSFSPSISANGRYVAYTSFASDLVPGDGNGTYDVFVRDLVSGTTVRASLDTEGGDPNSSSFERSISANGRYVAFSSDASDLVPGDGNGAADVFVRDLVSGTTVRASVDTEGGDPNSFSSSASISPNGRYVAFTSDASDLVPGDQRFTLDVFVRDLVNGTTVRASVDTEGGNPNGGSAGQSISARGEYVAFTSDASDLVPGDGNGNSDVFVRRMPVGASPTS
jgi:Tol biopolymer transport system component